MDELHDEIERLKASLEYQKELVYSWKRAARMYRGGLLQANHWSEAENAFLEAEELENRG